MSGDNPTGEPIAEARNRMREIQRMAGNIACGIEANLGTLGLSPEEVAERAEKIARAILARLEL